MGISYRHVIAGLSFAWGPAFAEAPANRPEADNSARNNAEQQTKAITAEQQGESTADVEVTKRIRQKVVADKSISLNGHNVKIITSNRSVVLKGPVATQAEKEKIEAKAISVAGAGHVSNHLEVERQH